MVKKTTNARSRIVLDIIVTFDTWAQFDAALDTRASTFVFEKRLNGKVIFGQVRPQSDLSIPEPHLTQGQILTHGPGQSYMKSSQTYI